MTLSTVTALAKLFGQYLLQPIPFTLTFLLPLLFRLIARKYIWLTLPLTALAEVLLNWDSFCYYEARSLALLFTLTQLAVMAVFVWILHAAPEQRQRPLDAQHRLRQAGKGNAVPGREAVGHHRPRRKARKRTVPRCQQQFGLHPLPR